MSGEGPPPGDSAGRPWAGRRFEEPAFAGDDGSAPEALARALWAFREADGAAADVVDAFRSSRVLIPLLADLGEAGLNDAGVTVDKSAELSIVTVGGPDGRRVLPVFSSVDAMKRWNASARPVPADGVRVALAAADEGTDRVVLDAGSEHEFALRRPALWAVAQSLPWVPSFSDPVVVTAFEQSLTGESSVQSVRVADGDPSARLRGPELLVTLELLPGLDQDALSALLSRLQSSWEQTAVIAERVDSMGLKLVAA